MLLRDRNFKASGGSWVVDKNIILYDMGVGRHTELWSIYRGDIQAPNVENLKIGLKFLCLMVDNTHDGLETVTSIF